MFCAVAGGLAPVSADPPPRDEPPEVPAWVADMAKGDPADDVASAPTKPATSAAPIKSTPLAQREHAATLPRPGVADVTLPDRGVAQRAGGSPVRLSAGAATSVGSAVRVEVLDQKAAGRAGVRGFAFRLSDPDVGARDVGAKRPVTLSVDYAGFADLYGAGYGSRLRLVALPACAVADPVPASCDRAGKPLPGRNDQVNQRVVADVQDLASVQDVGAAGGGVVLALMAGPESEGGSFKATPFEMSGDWQVGIGSGEFSWSYNFPVVAAPAGLTPDVNLSYSSGAVDGMVSSKNTQPGNVGLGWGDFANAFIERRYIPCSQDGLAAYGDLCWVGENASISLNGQSSELVLDPASAGKKWVVKSDNRWVIERLTVTDVPAIDNGDDNGEHWKVTTPDGTQYWFGIGSDPESTEPGRLFTGSTWTVPVVGNDASEPCHGVAPVSSLCKQAWRWNLDRVVDPNGNERWYEYVGELNRYRAVNGEGGHGGDEYVRAGYLKRIWYGTAVGEDDYAAQVVFDVNYRCETLDDPNPANELGGLPCPHPDDAPAGLEYPDVPLDLQCDSGFCAETSPTFFAKERYTGVHVCVKARGTCEEVDYFKFSHAFSHSDLPDEDTEDEKLFLTGIQRTGREVGPTVSPADDTTLTLPPTTFAPVALANRVLPAVTTESRMKHWRIGKVVDEFGREVKVTYGQPDPCDPVIPDPPNWDTNTKNCFPQLWGPEGQPPTFRKFNKWLVTQVDVKALNGNTPAGSSPVMVTKYFYGNDINLPAAAPQSWNPSRDQADGAWHHDQDPFLAQAYLSWSEWRGYQDVLVVQGQSRTRYKVFRGMDRDRSPAASGGYRTVNISSLDGTVVNTPDKNWLSGRILDQAALRADGSEETGTVHGYQTINVLNIGHDDLLLDANWVAENDTVTRHRTPVSGTVYRRQRAQTTYNAILKFPEQAIEHGWTDVTGDERCTKTEYVVSFTPIVMLDYPQRVTRHDNATTCSGTVVSRAETAYDGGAVGAAPTKGNPTTSRVQTAVTPSPAWSVSTTTYDRFGRPATVTDPNNRTTSTVRGSNNDAFGYPTAVHVTNAAGHVADTNLSFGRSLPTSSEDANDKKTGYAYDPLGRVTSVWQPTEWTSGPAPTGPASWVFAYDIDPERDEVPVIQTRQLQDQLGAPPNTARYLDTWVLYDSLLRERQTHTRSPDAAKVVVSDTSYDDQGRVKLTNVPEAVVGSAGNAVLAEPANWWRNRTQSDYDHMSRPVRERFFADDTDGDALSNNAQRDTATIYSHETVEVDPIAGGNTRTKTDGLGRTTEVAEHDGVAFRTTAYGYNKADQLLSVTDPANNRITYTYDMAGRRLKMTDPDAGIWEYTYDPAGNQTSVKDALAAFVHTKYDNLNRPFERRKDNPTTGQVLATWAYDAPGELGLLNRSTRVTPTGNWVVDVTGYDARNRPTGRSWDLPAGITGLSSASPTTPEFAVTYGYDKADHPTSVGYPAVGGLAAETVATTYDSFGLPDTMAGTNPYVSLSWYDDRARPVVFGFGPPSNYAMGKSWEYDLNQQLKRQQATATGGGLTQDRTIGYDQAGNITERNTTLSGAAFKECFGYDPRNRLKTAYTTTPATTCVSASNKGTGANPYNHAYKYTPDGNLEERNEGGTVVGYTYPAGGPTSTRPHAPTAVGSNTYTWNANGNQATRTISGVTQTLAWDAEHRLATLNGPAGNNSFTYDADGTRLLRQTPAGTTLYFEGHEVTVPAGGSTATAVRSYGFGGQPTATRTPTGVDYLVTDNQGSVEQTIPSGSTTAGTSRTYYPYGKLRTGGQPSTDHSWIGQIEDDSTGLSYLNARYYDPATGVFTAPDPVYDLARPISINSYAYAWNNPSTLSDPSGRIPCDDPRNCSLGRPLGNRTAGQANEDSRQGAQTSSQIVQRHRARLQAQNDEEFIDVWLEGYTADAGLPQAHLLPDVGYQEDPIEQGRDLLVGDAIACKEDPGLTMDCTTAVVGAVPLGRVAKGLAKLKQLFRLGRGSKWIKPALVISDNQFGVKAGKHAMDYGLNPSDPAARQWIRNHVEDIHEYAQDTRQGSWNPKGGGGSDYLFFQSGGDVVVTGSGGEFVTLLKGGVNNGWYKDATPL